ncbi:MAG: hypothetical protein C0404_04705 [Verrucomicrobia bacterium]|nr:hypothetical protein [Verrucomicrobiota bacterium]
MIDPSMKKCPGSAFFKQPTPDIVKCDKCGADTEIWSDESSGKCPACKAVVTRLTFQSCVDWCKQAKECLGEEKYAQYLKMKASLKPNKPKR